MKENFILKFKFIQDIKNFFLKNNYLDVLTPPVVESPGIEPHLHPFKVSGKNYPSAYLHTSPEFHMKELLSHGLEKIFTISYSFRDEPASETHRPQFLMLEWYRSGATYLDIQRESIELINQLTKKYSCTEELKEAPFEIFTIKEAFLKFSGTDLDQLKTSHEFKKHIERNFSHLPLPKEDLTWDDYFFLLFLNEIEPKLKSIPKVILKDYPASQAALSTIKETDPSVCERFEIYLGGIEIGNCFNELRDLKIQKDRFIEARKEREALYNEVMPKPKVLFQALERGLPTSGGIAVGVERLFSAITKNNTPFWPEEFSSVPEGD